MSTLDDFFTAPQNKCIECGTTENLHISGTTAACTIWLCDTCDARLEQESREQEAAERQSVDAWLARDIYEEFLMFYPLTNCPKRGKISHLEPEATNVHKKEE